MATVIGGFKDRKIESRSKVEPCTNQYVGRYRQALDVLNHTSHQLIGSDAVETGSTTSVIVATAHTARVGDLIKFSSGALLGDISFVQDVTTNSITLSQTLVSAPAVASTFQIWRPSVLAVDANGNLTVAITGSLTVEQGSPPWQVQSNFQDIATETTLANLDSKVITCDTSSVTIAALPNEGQQTMANSISVAVASDQTVLTTKDTRTGASAQEVQGVQTEGTALTGKIFPLGQREFFTSTVVIPHCLNFGGVNYLLSLNPDTGLGFIDYSPLGEVYVQSLVAHDAADSGNPIKVGSKSADYEPTTSDVRSGGQTAVAAADRANLVSNLYGEVVEGVNAYFFTLDNVSTTYNNTTTTATSTAKECWNYRQATFSYELTRANSPTDILFEIEISLNNGSTFTVLQNDFLGDLRESTASITVSGIKKSVTFPIACHSIRVKATATGTTASATFTVANACIYFRN